MPHGRSAKSLLLACGFGLLPVVTIAQSASSPPSGGPCYDMFLPEANTPPGAPILINKCTGQTYVLVRVPPKERAVGGSAYLWQPLAAGDHPDMKPKPSNPAPVGQKCFSFDGRQFCP